MAAPTESTFSNATGFNPLPMRCTAAQCLRGHTAFSDRLRILARTYERAPKQYRKNNKQLASH